MKFSCDRIALCEAISTVQKAVAVHSTLPVLEGILIKTNENKIILTGNDLEIGIECVIEASVTIEGCIVVNSKLFGEIINKFTGDIVYFNANENNVLYLKSGNSKFNITSIPADEFPEIQKFTNEVKYSISVTEKNFKDLVRHTIFAASTNDQRLILTGCLLEATKDTISMVAVDGHRLALRKINCDKEVIDGEINEVSFVIPSKTLNEITKIIDDNDEEMKIFCSDKNIRFEFDNVVFVSRLLEGDFIDYKKIIPSESKTTAKCSVRELQQAVERASLIITNDVAKSPIVLNLVDSELKIDCETTSGKVEEIVTCEMVGSDLEIGFNNKYLIDALKASSAEEILLNFTGNVNPCLITPVNGDDFKYIVLPRRL